MDGRRRRYLPGAANVEPRLTVLQAALFTDVCISGIFFCRISSDAAWRPVSIKRSAAVLADPIYGLPVDEHHM